MTTIQLVGAILFACALVHTFSAKGFEILARRYPRHSGLLHLLGEVEAVFGFWAFILILAMAFIAGSDAAIDYAESRQFTEPLFVFTVMVIAASRPILDAVRSLLLTVASSERTASRIGLEAAITITVNTNRGSVNWRDSA